MIVISAFGLLSSAYTLTNTNGLAVAYGNALPSWFFAYLVFSILIGLVNIVGLWMWKRWAIYSMVAVSAVGLVVKLFIAKPSDPNVAMVSFYATLISLGLWFWAIYRKWHYFE